MKLEVESILENIPVIDLKRNYWFIRTYSGEMYDEFVKNNYVGIGFNSVPYEYIKNAKTLEKDLPFINLKNYIDKNTDYKKGESTKWANQLINFEHNLKIDDIVIIPNRGGNYYSIGIVKSDTIIVEKTGTFTFNDKQEPYPQKRKKIEWIKVIKRSSFRGELTGLFSSHQGITDANRYSEIIESHLSNVFIKGDNIYLKLYFNQDEDINAFELSNFLHSLTEMYKIFNVEFGLDPETELSIKIKLQSKGGMILRAVSTAALISIVGLLIISDNPSIKVEFPLGMGSVEGKSDGALKSISNFKKSNQELSHNEQLFQDSLKRLKASTDSSVDESEVVDTSIIKHNTPIAVERSRLNKTKKKLGDGKK